jgi:hypothetical protein
MRIALIGALATISLTTGCNYNKECYDGVCKITEDGKVRWEGDPAKVAARQGKENAEAAHSAEIQTAYEQAPRRPASEKVRVAIMVPTAEPELADLRQGFAKMLTAEFGQDGDVQLADPRQVEAVVRQATPTSGGFGPPGHLDTEKPVDPETMVRRLRDLGLQADVVVFTHLAPKQETGFLKGSGGVAVAQVNRIELQGDVTSVFKFEAHRISQVGKSASELAIVGVDKKGKSGSADLKGKRNIESDRPAVKAYLADIKAHIRASLRSQLPSLAAVSELQAKYAVKGADQPTPAADALRSLFGK